MAHDVFLSYSSDDQTIAQAVLHGLEAERIRCWIAPRDVPPGAIWAQAIMDGINGSRVLVVVFSARANRSQHVLNEVDAAVRKGVTVVPFRIEDVMPEGALEYHLRSRHWLDALTPDLGAHVSALAEQLGRILQTPRADPPTPPPRPMPSAVPSALRARRPAARSLWRSRRGVGVALGAAGVLAIAGWSLTRERAISSYSFTVEEASPNGRNQASFEVRSEGLRFFEGPATATPIVQRQYASSFLQARTRFVNAEITLALDPPGRELRMPFACQAQRVGAEIVATIPITAVVQPTWSQSFHTGSYGRAEPGWWTPGRYRVECRYGDDVIAREWFTVASGDIEVPSEAPVSTHPTLGALKAQLRMVRLFEGATSGVPFLDRTYAKTFESGRTRYLYIEAWLRFDRVTAPATATITCRFLQASGAREEIGRVRLTYPLALGETDRWASAGWGGPEAGVWRPGEYIAVCDDGVATLGQQRFVVQ